MSKNESISVAIIGRPNVGKSTLFNRLIKERRAIETSESGTTRDRLYGDFSWRGREYQIVDTAGMLYGIKDEIELEAHKSTQIAVEQADIIMFVVDYRHGVSDIDLEIAKTLRKKTNVVLVINKCDSDFDQEKITPFKRLGIRHCILLSAISGRNSGDLCDAMEKMASSLPERKKGKDQPGNTINLSIIGRPNAGKSTLLNTILGEEKMIVSSLPGTTRDSQGFRFDHGGYRINLIDTAGMKRKSQIKIGSIEGYALLRSFKAIREADTVVYLVDTLESIVSLDQNLLGEVENNGKAIILAINKIDLWPGDRQETMGRLLSELQQKLNFMPWIPVVFISSKDNINVKKLLDQVTQIERERDVAISAADLTRLLDQAKERNGQINYINSLIYDCAKPVVFKIKTKGNKKPHFSHLRYLENCIRDVYPFRALPIFIDQLKNN